MRTATKVVKANFILLAIIRFFVRVLYFLITVGNYYPTQYRKNILVLRNISNQIGIITKTETNIELIVQVYNVGNGKSLIEEECCPIQKNRIDIYKGWKMIFDEVIKHEEKV